jgi:SAM-dependent methyltransferase
MLRELCRRAEREGLAPRIETRQAESSSLGVDDLAGTIDFALVFAVAHEVPDQEALFAQVARALKREGRILLAEPTGHVSEADFRETLAAAAAAGLRVIDRPSIRSSRNALLAR